MNNYVQPGDTITVTAPYALLSGGGCLVGSLFGIAAFDAAISTSVEIAVEGVFDITKATGAVSQGDRMYWDDTNKVVTTTVSGNSYIGRAVAAALSGDTTARVLLNESGSANIFLSTEQTGTGSAQSIAHGLGAIPRAAVVIPTDLSPATTGSIVVTYGTHTTTNVVVTVTTSKKYMVLAFL